MSDNSGDASEALEELLSNGPEEFQNLLDDLTSGNADPQEVVDQIVDALDETNTALEDLFIEANESSPFPGSDLLADIGQETQDSRKQLLDMLRDAQDDDA
jgi:hypothetical protein